MFIDVGTEARRVKMVWNERMVFDETSEGGRTHPTSGSHLGWGKWFFQDHRKVWHLDCSALQYSTAFPTFCLVLL